MSDAKILLSAYYEALYERLEARKDELTAKVDELLAAEIAGRGLEEIDESKFAAYRDACLAFVDERLEAYNPVGIQYLFERFGAQQAFELELQLNWYNSRAEYEALARAARDKAGSRMTDERIALLVDELIAEFGAFPDGSIISGYEAKPDLQKLPDYIVARAIEGIIR